ncbi:MAG: L-threonylcarbamoyladenylate synthase [Chloroflexi bacterium]|nr:MAG: L-threonylcarbamoyladenylate synthase [Chloroflexota bacterium]
MCASSMARKTAPKKNASRFCSRISGTWRRGPLTIILVAPRRGTLAFRVPDHPLARRLIAASGGGLPVTSANRSGEPDARTAQEVIAQLDGRIALVLDGGTTPGGVSSTVVDCTTDQIKIVRQGAISAAEIDGVLATVA